MRHLIAAAAVACSLAASAQKQLYIPEEWKVVRTDTLLYKEVDTENKYTWSKTRSKESENFILYWDKYYASDPKDLPTSDFYYVDTDDLLAQAEWFYSLNVGKLAFCDEATSNVSKYKMMILMNHSTTWMAYGGGYDFVIGALWLNPATCKPVGHTIAHEVGHSFQYMCYTDIGGYSGFHDPIGVGSTFWEQTAQWQAARAFPQHMWGESWIVYGSPFFPVSCNMAMTHEWHRYQSYWWHYYLADTFGEDIIGRVWRYKNGKLADANETLMNLMGWNAPELFRHYFTYAMKMATLDLETDSIKYNGTQFADYYRYNYCQLGDRHYQVAYASAPQSTGFNVVELRVPKAGTTVTTELTSLECRAALAKDDPAQFFNGDKMVTTSPKATKYAAPSTTFYNRTRGFRAGYVALLRDGTRQYLYEDKVYCEGDNTAGEKKDTLSCVVPAQTAKLYLVVAPSLKEYKRHEWDDDKLSATQNIANDDQWPYALRFLSGTDLAAQPVLGDDVPLNDCYLTFDVELPYNANDYASTAVTLSGKALAAACTSLQLTAAEMQSRFSAWSSAGPGDGRYMLYGMSGGSIVNEGYTANTGHWFNQSGNRSDYGSGYVFSEFDASRLTFSVGQFPGRLKVGKTYTVKQALRGKQGAETGTIYLTFNVKVTDGKKVAIGSASLKTLTQSPVITGIDAPEADTFAEGTTTAGQGAENVFNLAGQPVAEPQRGINIVKDGEGNAKKVLY